MKNRALTAAAILALPVAALAQNPVAVERPDTGKDLNIGHQQMELPATVLVDNLWIVDTDVCDVGNGDAIEGLAVFGVIYDLQVSDAFEVPSDMDITMVTMDYLEVMGGPALPQDSLVEFFEDMGGYPSEVPTFQMTGTVFTVTANYVSWYGTGTRLEVTFGAGEVPLTAGIWWVGIQPVDTTATGGWAYNCRKQGAFHIYDSFGRDGGTDHGGLYGGPYGGGYGSNDWVDLGTLQGYPGMSSMKVEGGDAGFTLTITGDCPGMMTLTTTGGTPDKMVAFAYGFSAGSTECRPVCPGVYLGIQNAKLLRIVRADGAGTASMQGNAPPVACGRVIVQALDIASCTVSNIVGI